MKIAVFPSFSLPPEGASLVVFNETGIIPPSTTPRDALIGYAIFKEA
jgi:hypothetical protein